MLHPLSPLKTLRFKEQPEKFHQNNGFAIFLLKFRVFPSSRDTKRKSVTTYFWLG